MADEFIPRSYNSIVITLKLESAARCPQDEEFSEFPIGTINSALSRVRGSCGRFMIRRAVDERKFVVTFERGCLSEIPLLVECLLANESVEHARAWDDLKDFVEKIWRAGSSILQKIQETLKTDLSID